MKNLERDRRRKKGAIGSQDGSFRTFERRTRGADGRSATCILVGGADVTGTSSCSCSCGSNCCCCSSSIIH
jgi:guanyl-specific ribonuclease Sa